MPFFFTLKKLGKFTLGDEVECRWDSKGKVWYEGVINKFKVENNKKKKSAFIKFSDGDKRWFHIRRGWMKIKHKADSEAEDSASDAADDLIEEEVQSPGEPACQCFQFILD
jgi:hypothetical protein